jgi:hypothetical protein
MLHPPDLLTLSPSDFYWVPVCFATTWIVLSMLVANLWRLSRDTTLYANRMHQIPCAQCRFFTANYQLKCTIHPIEALTEEAIGCLDYHPNDYSFSFGKNSAYTIAEKRSEEANIQ